MTQIFRFSDEKNEKLKQERDIDFETIIGLIKAERFLNRLEHPNRKKYPRQFVYEVEIKDYVYWVPCVITPEEIFLKTAFPSRKATKRHAKGQTHEKNQNVSETDS